MDNQTDLKHIRLIGMPKEILDELLRVPDNFDNIMDNILDDDETLPEMETHPIVSTYDGVSKFEDWEETDMKNNIVEAPKYSITYNDIIEEIE